MDLRLTLFLVLCGVTMRTVWCLDQDTQFLIERLERSTAANFTTTSHIVWHMDIDKLRPGNLIYTDQHSLKTSDGVTSTIIAGNTTEGGYREGRGTEAQFDQITGFTQITDKRVVVVDCNNSCLRVIDRLTGITSVLSGECQSAGYKDGHPGRFYFPWSVIRDKNDAGQLLVTQSSNNAVRTVGINSGAVGTFIKSSILWSIGHLTQDVNGDLYVDAGNYAVYRIIYREKTIVLISGSRGNNGYRDSFLLNSLFSGPECIVTLGYQALLVADMSNHKIRLIDIDTDKVSTLDLCSGCFNNPSSLLITNHSLYVGEWGRIWQITYVNMTTTLTTSTLITTTAATPTPTTTPTSTPSTTTPPKTKSPTETPSTTTKTSTMPTTTKASCRDRNVTVYITSNEGRALVKISPDVHAELSVGSHKIHTGNCTINALVLNNGTSSKTKDCPEVIRGIVSPSTGLSALVLTLDDTTHTLELPVGVYNYRIKGKHTNCSLKVEIKEYLLVREVELVARYDNVKCSVLSDKDTLSTLTTLANGNINRIREICKEDCSPKVGSQAKLSCYHDTLTVTWSTDVTFDGTVTEIPKDLNQRLTDSLLEESRYPILNIVVISRIPPLVYPTKTKIGAYAELVLTSSCLHNKKYDEKTDSCE